MDLNPTSKIKSEAGEAVLDPLDWTDAAAEPAVSGPGVTRPRVTGPGVTGPAVTGVVRGAGHLRPVNDDYAAAIDLSRLPQSPALSLGKRIADIVIASGGLVFFAPLMLAVYLAVRLDSRGPAIFAHRRVGLNGRMFNCYKFRTMVPNAEALLKDLLASDPALRAEWEVDRKLMNDPRVTRFGRFLRRRSLDELPQLWNVLIGDMSFVGPRPIVLDEQKLYGASIGHYLRCRPGLTGAWQASGRNDLSYEERVDLDVWYSTSWSMRRDIEIILRTVRVVLSGAGAA